MTLQRPLLAGRALAFFGLVLVSLNMRSAVASLSPLIGSIRHDLAIDTWAIAALGMIPPLCYGVFGMFASQFARWWGLERTLVGAVLALAIGLAGRASVHSSMDLLAWSVLLFAGMGVGNVLLPPIVKKYFPDRIALMTTVYVTMFSIGNFIPPLIAVPVADSFGWRTSLAIWAVTAAIALLPWLLLLRAHRRDGAPIEPEHAPPGFSPWRSPMTWAILALFFSSGFNSYSLFAWMPQLLADQAGVDPATSGALLGLYASLGLPLGMVVPLLVARYNAGPALVFSALGFYAVGYAGLIWWPSIALPLWVICAAMGTLTFAASLVLINLRTHSHAAATATSGFVQGVGYLCVAAGVLGFGLLHTAFGNWEVPLGYLMVCSLVLVPAGLVIGRREFIDDPM